MAHADSPLVAHQFDDAGQQRHAVTFGMWLFLATEVLFFGGMLLAYTVYRLRNPAAFAEAGAHTLEVAGGINTAVLLLSSFTMVLAVQAARLGSRFRLCVCLALTALLGLGFLAIKAYEYVHEIREGFLPGPGFVGSHGAELFFSLYFVMTGVHALHVSIGLLLIGFFFLRSLIVRDLGRVENAVDLLGLYWHFVDIVWVFLFPLIYLGGRHS